MTHELNDATAARRAQVHELWAERDRRRALEHEERLREIRRDQRAQALNELHLELATKFGLLLPPLTFIGCLYLVKWISGLFG